MSRYLDSDYVKLRGECTIKYSELPLLKSNLHVHDAYEIILLLSDNVEVFINDVSYPVPYGSLMLFNTMDAHRIKYNGNDIYRRYVVHFKPAFLNKLEPLFHQLLRCFFLRNFDKPNLLCLSEEELAEALNYYERLQEIQNKQFMRDDRLMLALGEFLIYVNELYYNRNQSKLSGHYNDYTAIYKAILYIHENFAEDIDRKKLSKLTGVNERTLCEHFKNVTGITTNQYILTYRLSVAKGLLLNGMQTTMVAEKTGFDNYSNFSRTFKNHVGISPKKYAMQFDGN